MKSRNGRVSLRDMTELLLVVPHPDDEAFGAGALLARIAAQGGRTATLTLTRGAAGRTLGLATRRELANVRERELRSALAILNVDDVTILDYQDFVPDDDRGIPPHPGLAGADEEELVRAVIATIERTQPRVMLTFPPNGANGHPDHVVTNRAVLTALGRTRHQPDALYYYASGRRERQEERPGFMPPSEMEAAYLPATHIVPAGEHLAEKLRAIAQHETQALSVVRFMGAMPERFLEEAFHRARPEVVRSGEPERVNRL